jgi:hypothetical protein
MRAKYIYFFLIPLMFSFDQPIVIWDLTKVEQVVNVPAQDAAGYKTNVSGLKVLLPLTGEYRIKVDIKDKVHRESDGARNRVIIYQLEVCDQPPCWKAKHQFSSAYSGSDLEWEFSGQKNQEFLITLWLPTRNLTRSGLPHIHLFSSIDKNHPSILRIANEQVFSVPKGSLSIYLEKKK